jgi:hypothetical protein
MTAWQFCILACRPQHHHNCIQQASNQPRPNHSRSGTTKPNHTISPSIGFEHNNTLHNIPSHRGTIIQIKCMPCRAVTAPVRMLPLHGSIRTVCSNMRAEAVLVSQRSVSVFRDVSILSSFIFHSFIPIIRCTLSARN